jgi:hypothetical protein
MFSNATRIGPTQRVTKDFELLGGCERRWGGGDCAWRVGEARVRKAMMGHVHCRLPANPCNIPVLLA